MLTSILSAVCALALSAASVGPQADTVNLYIINGEKVANFNGSQLVGETISDYKITTATNSTNGVVTVTKVHNICTNGKRTKVFSMKSSTTDGTQVSSFAADDGTVSCSVVGDVPKLEIYIDGKKSTQKRLGELGTSRIASITVLKAGGKEAMELTNDETISVMKVELRKDKDKK